MRFTKLWSLTVLALDISLSSGIVTAIRGLRIYSVFCVSQVTGAGHGIGRETCYLYAEEKAILVLWDIDENGIFETKKLLHDRGYDKVFTYKYVIMTITTLLVKVKRTSRYA